MNLNFDEDDNEDDGFDQEASEWFAQKQNAAARRGARAVISTPAPNRAAELAAQRAAQVTPGSLVGERNVDPFSFPKNIKVSLPTTVDETDIVSQQPVAKGEKTPAPAKAVNTNITFWTVDLASGQKLYAESWETLKARLKDHPGEWQAIEHTFANTAMNILGFFAPDQYSPPENSKKTACEIIVMGGKVFKAEG